MDKETRRYFEPIGSHQSEPLQALRDEFNTQLKRLCATWKDHETQPETIEDRGLSREVMIPTGYMNQSLAVRIYLCPSTVDGVTRTLLGLMIDESDYGARDEIDLDNPEYDFFKRICEELTSDFSRIVFAIKLLKQENVQF